MSILISCSGCPGCLFWLCCPLQAVYSGCPGFLFSLSYSGCSILAVLFWQCYSRVLAILVWLSWSSYPGLGILVWLSLLAFLIGFPDLAVLMLHIMIWLSWCGCPVLPVIFSGFPSFFTDLYNDVKVSSDIRHNFGVCPLYSPHHRFDMKLSPVLFHHGYRTEFPLMGYRIKRIAVRETIDFRKGRLGEEVTLVFGPIYRISVFV